MSNMKKAFAVRDFKDEGTGESFTVGEISVSDGAYRNYKAAGLVTDDAPEAQTAPAAKSVAKGA